MGRTDTELWTYKEVCAFAKLSRRFLEMQVSAGRLEHMKVGRAVRFSPEAVRRWLETYQAAK